MVQEQGQAKTQSVTFILPEGLEAQSASVVGDFNNWSPQAHPMHKDSDGYWRISIELETGKEYQFRYLVNGQDWYNDSQCECCRNPYGGENNLLRL